MIPLVAPSYDAADRARMVEAAGSGLFDGDQVAADFEQAVADLVDGVSGQGTPSGTAALHLALVAAGIRSGDEVITPSYTCIAVLHAIHLVGATPILVDNLDDAASFEFNVDPDRVHAAISARTRAVIVPHAFGVTADVGQLAVNDEITVIEDCAMALGSAREQTLAGSQGQFATFSFHGTKVISTGAGGMVVARDPQAALTLERANDYLAAQRADRTAPITAVTGSYRYACGYQLTDLQASLGLGQLAKLPAFIERRHRIAERYKVELEPTGVIMPTPSEGAFPFRYQVDLSPRGIEPTAAIAALAALGIEAGRGVYPALHQYLGMDPARFPRAERCTSHLLSLPVHPALSDADVEQVIDACKQLLQRTVSPS